MFAFIRTDELDALDQLLVKQLKSRYGNKNYYEKFVIGVENSKNQLYDVEFSAQSDILGGSDDAEEDESPGYKKPKKQKEIDGLVI
jgi:hypothetical protein